ncbi:MAG: chemotaxis protein CheW [Myxococcaceae bacterium]
MNLPRPKGPEAPSAAERELLEARAARLRERLPAEAGAEALWWAAQFPIGDEQFALPLASLRAALPLRRVTAVPLSEPHVIGVLRFQGQLIPALSLSALLGGSGWKEDPKVLVVVDPGWGGLIALDCEEIPKPVALSARAVEEARAGSPGVIADITTAELSGVRLIDLGRLLERRGEARGG